jgi:acetyltransferase-like isoleucine patch superfamily enzyme
MRALARTVRDAWLRFRFRRWTLRLGVELRRNGGRLRVEAPHGARLDGRPEIRALPTGEGSGITTLRIGRGVRIGRDVTLEIAARGENLLELGDGVDLVKNVRLEMRSGSIRLGPETRVRDHAIVKSDGDLRIGRGVTVSYGCNIHCHEKIEIGDHVGLADLSAVLDSDHDLEGATDTAWHSTPIRVAPTFLGDYVVLYRGAVVLRGTRIGANSVVAANAIVSGGEFPEGWLIAGNPAEPVKELRTGEKQ